MTSIDPQSIPSEDAPARPRRVAVSVAARYSTVLHLTEDEAKRVLDDGDRELLDVILVDADLKETEWEIVDICDVTGGGE